MSDLKKIYSIHELNRMHGLPLESAFVNRDHYMGKLYRDADYKEIGKGFLRWAEDFAYIKNPKTNKFEPLVWLNWEVTEILRVMQPSEQDKTKFKYLTMLFCWPRRYGKTMLASLIDTWAADVFENQNVVIGANSEHQAQSTAFDFCREIVLNSPALKSRATVGMTNVKFTQTRSEITAVPRSIPSMYGQSINVGHPTELCVAKNDEHYQVLASSTGDVQGIILVDSNFGSVSNIVYQLFELGMTGQDPTIGVSIIAFKDIEEAIEYNLSPYITEKWLRSRAMQMTSGEFKRNHLNQPSEGASNMFTEEQAAAVVAPWNYPLAKDRFNELVKERYITHMLGGGYDGSLSFSKRGDRTIWAYTIKGEMRDEILLKEYPEQFGLIGGSQDEELKDISEAYTEPYEYIVLECGEIKNNDQQAAQRIILYCKGKYGAPSKVGLEAYQAAGLYQWCSANNIPAELISPTTNVQVAMFNLFYQLVNARRLRSLKGQWLFQTELALFQADEVNSEFGLGKQVKLKVSQDEDIDVERSRDEPETIYVKDDSVYAVAHSIYCLKDAVPVAAARCKASAG
jgi:hypothetical protein